MKGILSDIGNRVHVEGIEESGLIEKGCPSRNEVTYPANFDEKVAWRNFFIRHDVIKFS